jgi:hypothetical protein
VVNTCDKARSNSLSDAADIRTGAEANLEHAISGPHTEQGKHPEAPLPVLEGH